MAVRRRPALIFSQALLVTVTATGCRNNPSQGTHTICAPTDDSPLNVDRVITRFPELTGIVVQADNYVPEPNTSMTFEFPVRPDHELRIEVNSEPSLSRIYPIQVDGQIDFPLIRKIPVVGRTSLQIQKDIEERLRPFLKDPQVLLNVEQIGGPFERCMGAAVTILAPNLNAIDERGYGQIEFLKDLTPTKLFDGWIRSEKADKRAVRIIRKDRRPWKPSRVIICDLMNNRSRDESRHEMILLPKDIVWFPAKDETQADADYDWALIRDYLAGGMSAEEFCTSALRRCF